MLHRKFNETVKTVTVSLTLSGKYDASVLVDIVIEEIQAHEPVHGTSLGIDLGIKSLAVCSDGRTFENPKNLAKNRDRLAELKRRLSRKRKGAENRNKARVRVKPVDCPLVDDRLCVLKSNGRKKQEKRGGIGISEAPKSLA